MFQEWFEIQMCSVVQDLDFDEASPISSSILVILRWMGFRQRRRRVKSSADLGSSRRLLNSGSLRLSNLDGLPAWLALLNWS